MKDSVRLIDENHFKLAQYSLFNSLTKDRLVAINRVYLVPNLGKGTARPVLLTAPDILYNDVCHT